MPVVASWGKPLGCSTFQESNCRAWVSFYRIIANDQNDRCVAALQVIDDWWWLLFNHHLTIIWPIYSSKFSPSLSIIEPLLNHQLTIIYPNSSITEPSCHHHLIIIGPVLDHHSSIIFSIISPSYLHHIIPNAADTPLGALTQVARDLETFAFVLDVPGVEDTSQSPGCWAMVKWWMIGKCLKNSD